MGATSLTAGQVMDKSASLMNDTAKTTYTYAAQLPYLQMALDSLQENFELNNIPITDKTSAAIVVNAGVLTINPVDGVGAGAAPNYPADLIEIQQLWERLNGSNDPYLPITKKDFIPHDLEVTPIDSLGIWAWINQRITFIGATTARQVKIDYICSIFPDLIDQDTVIGIMNAKSYLQFKTASLCSQFIGENPTRAANLNNEAEAALDRVLGVGTKGRQAQSIRRRPFRAGYQRRSFV